MPDIILTISPERAPAVRAAVLALHPPPADDDPDFIADETDGQWMQRVLARRFRHVVIAMMRKAARSQAADPDPGIDAP